LCPRIARPFTNYPRDLGYGRFEEGNAVYDKYLETQTVLNIEKSGE
jgi:hypothetical protein